MDVNLLLDVANHIIKEFKDLLMVFQVYEK